MCTHDQRNIQCIHLCMVLNLLLHQSSDKNTLLVAFLALVCCLCHIVHALYPYYLFCNYAIEVVRAYLVCFVKFYVQICLFYYLLNHIKNKGKGTDVISSIFKEIYVSVNRSCKPWGSHIILDVFDVASATSALTACLSLWMQKTKSTVCPIIIGIYYRTS